MKFADSRRAVLGQMNLRKISYGLIPMLLIIIGALVVNTPAVNHTRGASALSSNSVLFSSNEILVKLKPLASLDAFNNLNKAAGALKTNSLTRASSRSVKNADLLRWYKVSLPGSKRNISTGDISDYSRLKALIGLYKNNEAVETAELNYLTKPTAVPNDTLYKTSGTWGQNFPDLWNLKSINLEPAWSETTGSPNVIVANIDTGIDLTHPDLKDNIWVNLAEIPGNNLDDDNNGFIDDYYGWNFVEDNNNVMDDWGHGTHTAGTIAATGNNNLGVVGVNWRAKVMTVRHEDKNNFGYTDWAVASLKYAADMGAKISSNSWIETGTSQALRDAVRYEHDRGMTVVFAAGNGNSDVLDTPPSNTDEVITVAASNYQNSRLAFSNWGYKIDFSAPGEEVLSTYPTYSTAFNCISNIHPGYCQSTGTSMAAPHVSGLAALLLSKYPDLDNESIRQYLRLGADDLGEPGKDFYFGYGRINAGKTFATATEKILTPFISSPSTLSTNNGAVVIKGNIKGDTFSNYRVEYAREPFDAQNSSLPPATTPVMDWNLIKASNSRPINGVLAVWDTINTVPGFYNIRVVATDSLNRAYEFQVYRIKIALSTPIPPNAPTNLTTEHVTKNSVTLIWDQTSKGRGISIYGQKDLLDDTAGYKIFRDNVLIGYSASTSYVDDSLTPGSNYKYYVTAYTANGLESAASNTIYVHTPLY